MSAVKHIDIPYIGCCLAFNKEQHQHLVHVQLPWIGGDEDPDRENKRSRILDDGLGNTWTLKIDQRPAKGSKENDISIGNLHICLSSTDMNTEDKVTFQVFQSEMFSDEAREKKKNEIPFFGVGQEDSYCIARWSSHSGCKSFLLSPSNFLSFACWIS